MRHLILIMAAIVAGATGAVAEKSDFDAASSRTERAAGTTVGSTFATVFGGLFGGSAQGAPIFPSATAAFAEADAAAPTVIPAVADVGEGPVECIIARQRGPMSTDLAAVVTAREAVSGNYTFTVSGSGRGGSSSIRQGGDFDAAEGSQTILSSTTLSGGYEAVLTVKWPGGSKVCRVSSDEL